MKVAVRVHDGTDLTFEDDVLRGIYRIFPATCALEGGFLRAFWPDNRDRPLMVGTREGPVRILSIQRSRMSYPRTDLPDAYLWEVMVSQRHNNRDFVRTLAFHRPVD